jgi:hypothetical protein
LREKVGRERERKKLAIVVPRFWGVWKSGKEENRKKIASEPYARDTFELKERIKVWYDNAWSLKL